MVSYVYGFLVSSQYYVSKIHIHVVCRCSLFIFLFFLNIYLAAPGLCWGTRDLQSSLWHAGSFSSRVQTLSCGRWDPVPWPRIEPRRPALGARSLSHGTTREVPVVHLFFRVVYCSLQELLQFVYLVYSWLDVFTVYSFHSYKRCCHTHWLPVCRHNVSLDVERRS